MKERKKKKKQTLITERASVRMQVRALAQIKIPSLPSARATFPLMIITLNCLA